MKITTARLKEIIKEEAQSIVEGEYGPPRPGFPAGDPRDASSKARVDKEGAKEAFVVSDLYWLQLLLRVLTKSKKVNMRLLPKYTEDVADAIDSINRWNSFSNYQKERTTMTERDLDKHWRTLGVTAPWNRPDAKQRQQEALERWLPFHKGFNRALEDLERGNFDQADADAAEKYTLHVSNDLGYGAVLDQLDKSDPTGVLLRYIRDGNTTRGLGKRFNRRKAARNAAPWLKQILEPVRRAGAAIGLREIIDEELEAVLAEKEDDSFSKAGEEIEKKGTEGVFTAKAKEAGMGVQEFAHHVLANTDDFSAKTVDQASFAKGAATVARNKKK